MVSTQQGSSAPAYSIRPDSGFSILGDSISTLAGATPPGWRTHYEGEVHVDGVTEPAHTWWGQVIDHFGGHLVANAAFSGSVVEGFGFPAGDSPERVAALAGADGELPDVVLVFMGINDYGWGGGRNQVMGESLSASARPEDLPGPREVAMAVGPEALDRFGRAYASMLTRVRALAPQADIWCLTLSPATSPSAAESCYKYSIRGIELDAYNRAIAHAAAPVGAHVADIASFGVAYDAVDACHPSALGMRQIADMAIAQMEGLPADRALISSLAGAPTARRTCFERDCADCPLGDADPRRWTIACAGPRG
ncbi:MAG: SGNH/GDSL hydrolase family protein [Collinsella sp.]|nr:SGNH/GDSL hydrolase family protein [Collinsella sp.]